MYIDLLRKTTSMLLLAALYGGSSVSAAPISQQEIIDIYSNSSSLSSNKQSLNYYAPDGEFRSTNIKSGEQSLGRWHVTESGKICIKSMKSKIERCWRVTQTKRKICFSADGKSSCRAKKNFLRGDQTSQYLR